MKYFINKIIVVEGKEDASYLSSFIEAEYITTNGYDIKSQELDYINEASKYKEILVLVDPDNAGRDIENTLRSRITKATYLKIDISQCVRGKKKGVAECDKQEIIKVLNPHFSVKISQKTRKLQVKLNKIDFSDKELRSYICERLHLGICNLKKLFTRLETLQISDEKVLEIVQEFYGN